MAEQETRHEPQQKHEDAARKRLADEKAAREKRQAAQFEASANVKPTPTQEENDLAASGVQITLEPDGSPEQPPAPPPPEPPPEGGARKATDKATDADKTRQAEADKNRAGYSTRSADAKT